MRTRRAVFAIVMAAMLAVPATAEAATKPLINLYTGMSNVPSHVAAGGTLSFTETFVEKSNYDAELELLSVEVWNTCLCSKDHTDGTVARYLDPSTQSWKTTSRAESDSYTLNIHMRVKPGQTILVPVRINLAGWPSGTYKLSVDGTTVGNVLASDGTYDFAWQFHTVADRGFSVGSVAAKPKPTPAPTSTHHSTTTTSRPAQTLSSPTATSTRLAPAPSPSAIWSPTVSALPVMSVKSQSVAPRDSTSIAAIGYGALALMMLVGSGAYLRRRRRPADAE